MKTRKPTFILTTIVVVLFCATSAFAQDWSKLDSKTVKILTDTTRLRAMEVTIMPGDKGEVHTHPAHFFYALTDGKLIVHYTDGKTETIELKAGECGYSDPERPHWAENGGDKPLKFLLVELKEHPYKEPTKK